MKKAILSRRGFSLIEIMVVLAIALSLAGFTLAVSGGHSRQKLNLTASTLAEDVRLTQKLNQREDGKYKIYFDDVNKRYIISRGVYAYKIVKLPVGIDITGSTFPEKKLWFIANGSPNPTLGGHVTMIDKKNNKLYVIVTPFTGRVRIDKTPP